jgi:hypothetical protein
MRLAPLRGGRKPEVQMAPLIDIIFLLLLFYAVTTQFVSDERLKLKLPEAETAENAGTNQQEKPPEVKVAVDGTSGSMTRLSRKLSSSPVFANSWSELRTRASSSRATRVPTMGWSFMSSMSPERSVPKAFR